MEKNQFAEKTFFPEKLTYKIKILKYFFLHELFCHAPPFLLLFFFSVEEVGAVK